VRRSSLALIAAAVLAGPLATSANAGTSVWSSSNGLLAFRSDRAGEADVYSIDPAGGTPTRLTDPGVAELQPAWSAEGERIAFVRRPKLTGTPDLFVMTANGTGRTRLTSTPVPERDPAWSPNGTMLAYAARTERDGPFRIFIVKADGSGRRQLTTQAAGSADRSPAWSPDGSRIVFVSDRDGGFPELYLMNADGTGVVRLTNNAVVDGNPSWSPNGSSIVFERCCENGTSDLFTIDVLLGIETNLTASTDQQEFDPAWSPDGTKIAYVSFLVGQGNIDIWIANADGSGPLRLTQESAPDTSPDWQPLPACTITGSTQADHLVGTDGNDVICGLAGPDDVQAGAGDDLVVGGPGDDSVAGRDGGDLLLGESGNDTLGGGAGYDVLDGGGGTDTCVRGADGAFLRLCEL